MTDNADCATLLACEEEAPVTEVYIRVRIFLSFSVLVLALLLAGLTQVANSNADQSTGEAANLVVVHATAPETYVRFEKSGLPLYARLTGRSGDSLITSASPIELEKLAAIGLNGQALEPIRPGDSYYVIYPAPERPVVNWPQYGKVLIEDSRYLLLRIGLQDAERLARTGVELAALTLEPKPLWPRTDAGVFPDIDFPDPDIQLMIGQIVSTTVSQYNGGLSGEWPVLISGLPYTITTRYTYSGEPIQQATEYVGQHLAGLGLDVEYHQWSPYDATLLNVIGQITGETQPEDIFIISAHLDDMPPGSLAPGADDNGSGTTAVLIAADIFSQYRWDCTIRFALWTGEEQGLLGSHSYAQRAYNDGENIAGVLNLDMIGWNTLGSSPDMDLHAKSSIPASLDLAQLFADIVNAYGLDLIPEIVNDGTGASDHASFWSYGYTAILGIEDYVGSGDFNPYYHTVQDSLAHLDIDYFTEMVRASLATTAHMANCLIPPGELEGQVTASGSGAPIENALINIDHASGWRTTAETNSSGHYSSILSAGAYTVTVTANGYMPSTNVGVEISANGVTNQDFALLPGYFGYLPVAVRGD